MNIDIEDKKKAIEEFNLSDDPLFEYVMEDVNSAEEMIKTILDMPNLRILEAKTQSEIRNIFGRSVILDALCIDENGRLFNVEMQNAKNDDMQKRMRFNISNIDRHFLKKGARFTDLPDVYGIMICNFDIFKENHSVYYINRVLKGSNRVLDNGIYEVYVNLKGRDNPKVDMLSSYILNSNGVNNEFPHISNRVNEIKKRSDEQKMSTTLFDKFMNEVREEGIAQGMEQGREQGREQGIAIAVKNLGMTMEEYNRRIKQ